jgi:hypothetical protein
VKLPGVTRLAVIAGVFHHNGLALLTSNKNNVTPFFAYPHFVFYSSLLWTSQNKKRQFTG